VVVDASPTGAASTVAVPVLVFVLLAGAVHAWIGQRSPSSSATSSLSRSSSCSPPLTAGLLSLGGAVVMIGLLVATLVIASCSSPHRAMPGTDQQGQLPRRQPGPDNVTIPGDTRDHQPPNPRPIHHVPHVDGE